MVSHSLVLGYHGCDKTVARKVANGEQELLPSEKPGDWLARYQKLAANASSGGVLA